VKLVQFHNMLLIVVFVLLVKPPDVHRKRTVPMLFGAVCTPAHPDCILQCNIKPLTTLTGAQKVGHYKRLQYSTAHRLACLTQRPNLHWRA
jgi:hypothetical protein